MIAQIKAGFSRDRAVLPGLVMTALLLTTPNLVCSFWPRFNQRLAENFWSGLGLVLLPCVLPLTARTALRLWLPFTAFLPAVLVYLFFTGSPLREWALVVLLETDWHELERFWSGAVLSAVLAPPTVWFFHRFMNRHLPAGHRLAWPMRVVIVLFSCIMPLRSALRNSWDTTLMDTQRKLSATFPAGLAVSAASAARIRHQLDDRRSAALPGDIRSTKPAPREIAVLVIGESARFASFQINGYTRETTPLLSRTEGVLSFRDVTAPATVTLMSVPALLTGASADHIRDAPSLPSVVGVFRRAGFQTAWLSTQKKHGMYDTACSIFSHDGDESKFVSGSFAPGAGNYASALDGDLLPPLREILARDTPRRFIVIHTMGSHQHYADRYPDAFNHFPCPRTHAGGDFLTGTFTREQKKQLTDAYDNTIRYTDWFLSEIITSLQATGAVASLYYISDHGQNMGDSPVLPFGHGTQTRDVVRVPLIVWLSPAYRQWRPEQTAALESHRDTPFGANTTFHTLIDMAGLDGPVLDRKRSAASADFSPGPRHVRSLEGAIVDYDALFPAPSPAR